MSSRSRRDAALNNVESLILVQAVWEHGANAWPVVAKILSRHPLISRPKSFFTAQSSHAMYDNLMKEAGLERTEASNAIHSAVNHTLAEKFYRARVEELRGLIVAEETKFKTILSEIESIRSGNFDGEITARITGVPIVPTERPKETEIVEAVSSPDEVFGGSELSGLTATPASPSQTQENPPEEPEPTAPESLRPLTPRLETPVQTPAMTDNIPSPLLGAPSPTTIDPDVGAVTEKRDAQESVTRIQHPEVVVPCAAASVPVPSSPSAAADQGGHIIIIDDEDKQEHVEKEVKDAVPKEDEAPEETKGEIEAARTKEKSFAGTPSEEIDVSETREVEAGPTTTTEVPTVQEPLPDSSAVPEVEAELAVDDGESSGDEPLHVSRRSTRRRRSTLSPVQPLTTRGKARRHRAESPPIKVREEFEADHMDEADDIKEGTPVVDLDHDASPTPVDVSMRRREGKRKASFVEGVESLRERKRARDDSEPVDDDEPGPNLHSLRGRRTSTRSEEQVALKRFQNVIGMLHSQISQHRNGNIFHNPIKNSEAPDYHEIVKRPMDLKTIKMRVKDGSIGNSLEYQRDIFLMFANALMYNRPGSDVHTMAEDMMIESEGHIHAFRQTEGLVRGAHRT